MFHLTVKNIVNSFNDKMFRLTDNIINTFNDKMFHLTDINITTTFKGEVSHLIEEKWFAWEYIATTLTSRSYLSTNDFIRVGFRLRD